MFETLRNAWRIPDLRKKLLFTLLLLVVYRFGSVIPVPFLDSAKIQEAINATSNNIFGIMDLFSGGALGQGTIFALGISPYINSSIIFQLLTVAIPALERLQKEGPEGRKKINQYMRYATVFFALVQAYGIFVQLSDALTTKTAFASITVCLTLTAGTAFLMWLGEQITERGIGNGISMIIFAGIVARLPHIGTSLWANFKDNIYLMLIIVIFALLIVALVVLMNNAERRIPVQYAKRVVGRKMYGGQSTHIPIKVAMAGVIPIIFAISILAFPSTLIQIFNPNAIQEGASPSFWTGVANFFSQSNPGYSIMYFLLVLGFTYFYTAITFNPIEIANNMKKNGGFVPGIRPGKPTSDYITKIMSRITLAGAVFLGFIAVLPILLGLFYSPLATLGLGGTSILILVGVALETVKQIESQMLMRHYKGFLE